jgi:hypothetical protein
MGLKTHVVAGGLSLLAALAAAGGASAAPYNDTGEFATFTIGGNFTLLGDPPPTEGDVVRFTTVAPAVGGTEEFQSVDGFAPVLDPVPGGGDGFFDLVLQNGGANAGEFFTVDFDRAQVTDPANGNALGSETGTFTLTLTGDTTYTVQTIANQQRIEIDGDLDVDATTFYDSNTPGSFSFAATIGTAATSGTYSLTVSVPPASEVPLPASALLLLTGIAGLGYAGSRRRRR